MFLLTKVISPNKYMVFNFLACGILGVKAVGLWDSASFSPLACMTCILQDTFEV